MVLGTSSFRSIGSHDVGAVSVGNGDKGLRSWRLFTALMTAS